MADIKSKSKGIRSQSTITETTTGKVGPGIGEPVEEENAYLSVAERLAKMKREAVSPADYTQVKAAEDQAERLYNERADRSEWLSLAEKLGNAVTRIGASQAGNQMGADMSKIDYGPGIDWEGRNRRYAGDLDRSLSRGKTERSALDQTQATNQKVKDRDYEDTRDGTRADLDFKKYIYGQKYDTYQQSLRDGESFKRTQSATAAAENRADQRLQDADDRRSKSDAARSQDDYLKLENARLGNEIKTGEGNLGGASGIAAGLVNYASMDKKSKAAFDKQLDELASKGAVSPGAIAEIKETDDPKTKELLVLKNLINPIKIRIEELKKQREDLIQGSKGQPSVTSRSSSESVSTPVAPSPEPSDDLVSQYVKMYSQVTTEQAKDILRKRMTSATK